MDHQEALEVWRKDIRQIDEEILRLAAKRMELAVRIGGYKKDKQLPIKDFRVEKQIVDKARDQAASFHLDPDFAEDLMTLLIRFSVQQQDTLSKESSGSIDPTHQHALIIGGKGKMGKWFAQYYQALGYTIWIHDQSPEASPYLWHESLSQNLDRYEVILLATPLEATNQLLKELAARNPRGLIIETSSLKNPVREGLEAMRSKGLRLASIHPMFGPETDLLAGKNILFCTGEGLCSQEVMEEHFKMTSAHLSVVKLEEHDQEMQYTLGLSHFINLFHAFTLQKSAASLQRLKARGGPTFLEQLQVTEAVVHENPDLSFEIQTLNSFQSQLMQQLDDAFKELFQLIKKRRKDEFLKKVEEVKTYFKT